MRQKKGFTLIELLVAILMPVLGKVKHQARKSVYGAHEHNLAQSYVMYASDNDDRFIRIESAQPLYNTSGYGTTANSIKGLTRLICYMGLENVPYRYVQADMLLENQSPFRSGGVSLVRNTNEMFMQCLMESPYRREELLAAMDGHSGHILSGSPWRSHITGDYAMYCLAMLGPFLHWQGYEESTPRTKFYQGVAHYWRVEVGPFGRCVA